MKKCCGEFLDWLNKQKPIPEPVQYCPVCGQGWTYDSPKMFSGHHDPESGAQEDLNSDGEAIINPTKWPTER